MKKLALLITILIVLFSFSSCTIEGYHDGYEDGFEDGKETVRDQMEDDFEEWYDMGYDDGKEAGETNGNSDGYDEGYTDGYADGEADGYYAGATYTCLFFGDVDRAFQCANNGCAWLTFISAYDQYIADIYSDEDTESALFWAFISLTVGEDATKEEIELLINTFGEDLFTRNGISITP